METNLAYRLEQSEEIIDGQVVMMATPSSNHNRINRNLSRIFDTFLEGRPCEYFPDREGLFLEEGKEEYQPDGMVVCDPEKVQWDGIHGAPDLVVEVLSKSTVKNDRGHKKDIYEKHGVQEYWIIDPEGLSLEQYLLTDGKYDLRAVYHQFLPWELEHRKPEEREAVVTEFRCSLFDGLTIRLSDVFARVTPRR